MATARFTVGVVLDTVNVAASTVTSTLNVIGKSAGMANAFIDKKAEEQTKRYAIEAVSLDYRLAEQAGRERAVERKALESECDADPVFKRHFEDAYKEYLEVLRPSNKGLRVAAE